MKSNRLILILRQTVLIKISTEKYDIANFKAAKYFIDNIEIREFVTSEYKKNIIYDNQDTEIVFETSKGAAGLEYKFPSAIDTGDTFTFTFTTEI